MKKEYMAYLSALIFLAYGFMESKTTFIVLGFVFLTIGIAERLKK